MKHLYLILLVVGLSVSYDVAPTFSQQADVQSDAKLRRVMDKIKERETTLKTFTATFKQTKTSQLLREPLYSEGVIYLDVEGKMLMKVIFPAPLILLFKDHRQVIYYPDLSRVEEKSFGKTDDIFKQYLGLGASIEALKAKFDIQLSADASAERYRLKMTPKQRGMAKHITEIDVVVDATHWLPEQVHFREKGGDGTTIRMQYTSINEPIASSVFEIAIPEDVAAGNRIR